jgi:ABC-type branched-subunit amino acid transport system ATPase component
MSADISEVSPTLLHVDRVNKRFGAVVAAADIMMIVHTGE